MAAILSLLEILRELAIAFRHLLLAELVTLMLLLQHEQQIWLPVAFQTLCNLFLTRLYARIPKLSELMRIALADAKSTSLKASDQPTERCRHEEQGRSDFRTWATRIVINAALQQIRRSRTRLTVTFGQVDDEFHGAAFSEYLRDPQPTPEEQLRVLEHREMLEDALHKLPVEIRRAVHLCKSTDYSLKEAAGALGLSVSALKARLHRGRRALIAQLKREAQGRPKPG